MPATTSPSYESQAWPNDDQQRDSNITAGANDLDSQWTAQNFDTMDNAAYYSPMLYSQPSDNSFDHSSTTYDNTSLHPSTTLSSSATHETFSPLEYTSNSAYGDPLSDYGTPGFENSFPDFYQAQMMNTISPASLLSSPEQHYAQTVPPSVNFIHTDTMPMPMAQPQSNMESHLYNNTSAPKSTRPRLVVTVDEYEGSSSNNEAIQPARRRNSSKAHLSPYPDDDSSSDDESEVATVQSIVEQKQMSPTHSIAPTTTPMQISRSGIPPERRTAINVEDMPTLDAMEQQHRIDERNAGVQDWLTNSDVGSNAEDETQPRPRRNKLRRPRAKSTNDRPHGAPHSQSAYNIMTVPGPGLTLNEPSELDEDEEYDTESASDSPPAGIRIGGEADSYFDIGNTGDRSISSTTNVRKDTNDLDKAVTGITANMAIMRFRQRAQDTDSASVTATLGSRRLSESDIGSVLGAAGISKLLLSPQQSERQPRRKNSFLGNILPNLNMSTLNHANKLKRKNSQPVEKVEIIGSTTVTSPKEPQSTFTAPKRIGSFGRSKTPKVDTAISPGAGDIRSPKSVANTASGMVRQIWRSRSRSDLGKSPKLGLAELMTQHGGPPIPTLVSPLQPRVEPVPRSVPQLDDDSDNEDSGVGGDGLTMDLSVRTDMHIIPTLDGFKFQTRQLNPRIADFLLERVAYEQVKRYKRLVDGKTKHGEHALAASCSAKGFCLHSGGQSQDLPPRPGNKDPESALVGFQIMRPGMTEDDLDMGYNGQTMVAAQFPTGVPLPPVQRLPAEFECPLCFKVKKFFKPSDWTKHVHEDVQPFICTFDGCNESKPFKRKADWVRHENERHRQLESWVCSVQDCNHTCYRKDNFVQHLVREHRVPDPKARTGRASVSRSPLESGASSSNPLSLAAEGVDSVWDLVDRCHHDSTKHPKDEPCKFCGNICTSWKKLTVHLAKHMEQISMPILPLVEQKKTSFAIGYQPTQLLSETVPMVTKPYDELPTFLYAEPTSFEAEPQSMLGVDQAFIPGAMHTYPPANLTLQAQMVGSQADLTATALNLSNASYPPPSVQSRSRGSSFNDQDFSSQAGTTYPPVGMHSRHMSASASPQFDGHGNQMHYTQYMQEPLPTNNVYLTPTSNTPASMGFSPGSSTHSLHQTYGFQG